MGLNRTVLETYSQFLFEPLHSVHPYRSKLSGEAVVSDLGGEKLIAEEDERGNSFQE